MELFKRTSSEKIPGENIRPVHNVAKRYDSDQAKETLFGKKSELQNHTDLTHKKAAFSL
jgi:hypothetical protein